MDKKILNNIITKLSEEEKVELTVVDDIKFAFEQGNRIKKEIRSALYSYGGLLRSGKSITDKIEQLEKQASELGIKPPQEVLKLKAKAKLFTKQGIAAQKTYNLFK
jgi:hypothetical protein